MEQSYNLTRKHVAERRRRARINQYLTEIERLVLPLEEQVSAVKLEKAEVLERTVAYLKEKRTDGNDSRAYTVGYVACLQSLQQLAKKLTTQSDLHSLIGNMLTNVQRKAIPELTNQVVGETVNTPQHTSCSLSTSPPTHDNDSRSQSSYSRRRAERLNQNQSMKLCSDDENLRKSYAEYLVKTVTKEDYPKEIVYTDEVELPANRQSKDTGFCPRTGEIHSCHQTDKHMVIVGKSLQAK
ncbi:enhancer of split m7 protein-like [Gigantopelta aegis]|uniref:enhancer of split m7 protein-like n=1 Tax=Gigantopelta aegis TaxID=1735272 RepID=UPI001B88C5FD|nr:enhancer of split m7 protein-like [Gigantopelta aegis]